MQVLRFPTPRVPLRQKGDLPPCLVPKPPLWGATSILLTHNNETLGLSEWARRYDIKRDTLYQRIYTLNWPVSRALTSRETE